MVLNVSYDQQLSFEVEAFLDYHCQHNFYYYSYDDDDYDDDDDDNGDDDNDNDNDNHDDDNNDDGKNDHNEKREPDSLSTY